MGYVIAAVLVLLIVAAGVTFFVLNATRRERRSAATDRHHGAGAPGDEAAIVAPDSSTPLGDTDQHAGEQTSEGRTVSGAEEGAGARTAGSRPAPGDGGLSGEAEGGKPVVESEHLANRER